MRAAIIALTLMIGSQVGVGFTSRSDQFSKHSVLAGIHGARNKAVNY